MRSRGPQHGRRQQNAGGRHPSVRWSLVFRGVTIALVSDHEVTEETLMNLKDDVTGMCVEEPTGISTPDGTLIYVPADTVKVAYRAEKRELVLRGPVHLFGSGITLAYIAQYMAECLRATKSGLLLIHAAAVRSPGSNSAILILGEKGAGKTTLALRLCHQYGYWLIGNDQVFLGPKGEALVTAGGNAWFNLRETAISADQYLAQLFPSPAAGDKAAWNSKTKLDPQRVGVGIEAGECPVEAIFHIRIDRTQPRLYVGQWVGTQRNLILHERFGRHVSGQATPLQDDHGNYLGSLPPIDSAAAMSARDELVHRVIRAGIVEVFAPTSGAAADYITRRRR